VGDSAQGKDCLGLFAVYKGSCLAFHSMLQSLESLPPWWDREFDLSGRPIRPDVRKAAIKVWRNVCEVVEKIRGDCAEAQELLEKAVAAVSIYLNKKNVGLHDPGGLLVVAVHRAASRLSRRERMVQTVGGTSELSEMLRAPDWLEAADRRLFLQKLVSELNPESRGILQLRIRGLEWQEIGAFLQVNSTLARNRFWKDVRRAHLKLLQSATGGGEK
jgi:DNA-directed RNA polymerase specialized sigma24 family protein